MFIIQPLFSHCVNIFGDRKGGNNINQSASLELEDLLKHPSIFDSKIRETFSGLLSQADALDSFHIQFNIKRELWEKIGTAGLTIW